MNWLITWAVGEFADEIYAGLKEWFNLQDLAIKKHEVRVAFDRASVECKIVARNYGITSVQFRKVRDEHKVSLSRFVRHVP